MAKSAFKNLFSKRISFKVPRNLKFANTFESINNFLK